MERSCHMVVYRLNGNSLGVPHRIYPRHTINPGINACHRHVHPLPAGIEMEIRDPKKLAGYIAEMRQKQNVPVRIQDDGTIDLMFSEMKRLEPAIESVKCPYCDIPVREHQPQLDENIRGMYLRCPECNQRFFVHLFVPFGGTPA